MFRSILISEKGYRKGDPQKNPDIDYIFTENAQAAAKCGRLSGMSSEDFYEHLNMTYVKINVSDIQGKNSAGIRTDKNGNISPNAYGIIVKKYQQNKYGKFVAREGQFEDNEEDFKLFKKVNLEFFQRLDSSSNNTKIFPKQIALNKAALPKRFIEFLKDEIYNRYGINSIIKRNINSSYDGYGLFLISVENEKENQI